MRKETLKTFNKTGAFIKSRKSLIIGLVLALCTVTIGSFSLYQAFADSKEDTPQIERIEDPEILEKSIRESVELETLPVEESEAEPYAFGGDNENAIQSYQARVNAPRGLAQFGGALTLDVFDRPINNSQYKVTYLNGASTVSGVVPFYDRQNGFIKIMISNVEGWVDESKMILTDLNPSKSLNHYRVKDGRLIFYIANDLNKNSFSGLNNGPAPKYLKEGVIYYSQDGHHFYTNLNTMVQDLSLGTTSNSLNGGNPFYNYYQYLSFRASSDLKGSDLDKYLVYKKAFTKRYTSKGQTELQPNESIMYGLGSSFDEVYQKYGMNTGLLYGMAINESGWGRGRIAINKNNLFSYNAVDSNPDNAIDYNTVEEAVSEFGYRRLNWNYFDVESWFYNGAFLGDKSMGMNTIYASDPFWGMKAAEHHYDIDRVINNKEYGRANFAVGNKDYNRNIYKNPQSGQVITKNAFQNQVMLVLGETQVNGEKWYKVAVDSLVEADRSLIKWKDDRSQLKREYNRDAAYGYVPASSVTLIQNSSNTEIQPEIQRGDINGDKEIDVVDLAMLKAHLENTYILKNREFSGGDINKDSEIDVVDLAMLKAHLEGTYIIEN